jgi:hypothetical protein
MGDTPGELIDRLVAGVASRDDRLHRGLTSREQRLALLDALEEEARKMAPPLRPADWEKMPGLKTIPTLALAHAFHKTACNDPELIAAAEALKLHAMERGRL